MAEEKDNQSIWLKQGILNDERGKPTRSGDINLDLIITGAKRKYRRFEKK